MDNKQFNIITEKIDLLSKALLLNLVKDLEFKDQVKKLSSLGIKEIEIVNLLNSNRDKVHAILRTK